MTLQPKKYITQTWGCQMNERDTEIIHSILKKTGMEHADRSEEADIIILVTCCVREKAENKVYGKLGQLAKLKENNPNLLIGVYGCMVQQKGVAEKLSKRFPEIDLIVGTHNLHKLPEYIDKVINEKERIVEVWEIEGETIAENLGFDRKDFLKSKVIISYGCNNYCSYCIVPYVRGRERSRKPESILNEIRYLADNGCKEVMLLGQNVNSYGNDLNSETDFASLLEKTAEVEGIKRIRYMTSHPKDFPDKLVKTLADYDKICNHIHLPVQAGSDKVLKTMNRGYTRSQYIELAEKIKENIPEASITTDLIVGFPGEDDEDFAQTLDLVKKVSFDNAFTFKYSPRKGTKAANYQDNIPEDVKKERLQKLMEVQNEISLRINKELVGKTVEIFVDNVDVKTKNKLKNSGRTSTNKIVSFDYDCSKGSLYGTFQKVLVTSAQTWSLAGELAAD